MEPADIEGILKIDGKSGKRPNKMSRMWSSYTFFNGNPISNWMPFMTARKITVDRKEGELVIETQEDGIETACMIKVDKETHSKTWGVLDDCVMGGNSMSKNEVHVDEKDQS